MGDARTSSGRVMSRPRILISMRHYEPAFRHGGPIRSVVNLVAALHDEFDFKIVCLARDHGQKRRLEGIEEDVWLMIYKKHAGTPSVTLQEAMQEAICFGWIDSSMQPIDEERYSLRFTPRRKTSNWSERNKGWAAKLIEEGRMTEAGLAKIEEAKRNGRWDKA